MDGAEVGLCCFRPPCVYVRGRGGGVRMGSRGLNEELCPL